MTNDGSEPMSQFCLGATKISAVSARSPLILLDLKYVLRRPLNETPNQPKYQISPDLPQYVFLFEANFPNKDDNPIYQMWLADGNIKANYIGIGLNTNYQDLANSISEKEISPVITFYVYNQKPRISSYEDATSLPSISFSGDSLPLSCN